MELNSIQAGLRLRSSSVPTSGLSRRERRWVCRRATTSAGRGSIVAPRERRDVQMTSFERLRVRLVVAAAILLLGVVAASAATAARGATPTAKPYTAAQWNSLDREGQARGIGDGLLKRASRLPPGSRQQVQGEVRDHGHCQPRRRQRPRNAGHRRAGDGQPQGGPLGLREQAAGARRVEERLGRRCQGALVLHEALRPHEVRQARQSLRRRDRGAWHRLELQERCRRASRTTRGSSTSRSRAGRSACPTRRQPRRSSTSTSGCRRTTARTTSPGWRRSSRRSTSRRCRCSRR